MLDVHYQSRSVEARRFKQLSLIKGIAPWCLHSSVASSPLRYLKENDVFSQTTLRLLERDRRIMLMWDGHGAVAVS